MVLIHAFGTARGTVQLAIDDKKETYPIAPNQEISLMALAQSGEWLFTVVGSQVRALNLWTKEITKMTCDEEPKMLLLTPKENCLVIRYQSAGVKLYMLPLPSIDQPILSQALGKCVQHAAAVSNDQEMMVLGEDQSVSVWDMKTFEMKTRLNILGKVVKSLAISDNKHLIAAGTTDGTIVVWANLCSRTYAQLAHINSPITCMSFSGTNPEMLLFGNDSRMASIWELGPLPNGRVKTTVSVQGRPFRTWWNPDTKCMEVCTSSGKASVSLQAIGDPDFIWVDIQIGLYRSVAMCASTDKQDADRLTTMLVSVSQAKKSLASISKLYNLVFAAAEKTHLAFHAFNKICEDYRTSLNSRQASRPELYVIQREKARKDCETLASQFIRGLWAQHGAAFLETGNASGQEKHIVLLSPEALAETRERSKKIFAWQRSVAKTEPCGAYQAIVSLQMKSADFESFVRNSKTLATDFVTWKWSVARNVDYWQTKINQWTASANYRQPSTVSHSQAMSIVSSVEHEARLLGLAFKNTKKRGLENGEEPEHKRLEVELIRHKMVVQCLAASREHPEIEELVTRPPFAMHDVHLSGSWDECTVTAPQTGSTTKWAGSYNNRAAWLKIFPVENYQPDLPGPLNDARHRSKVVPHTNIVTPVACFFGWTVHYGFAGAIVFDAWEPTWKKWLFDEPDDLKLPTDLQKQKVLAGVATGVAYIHSQGILCGAIHMDNVLVARDQPIPVPRILSLEECASIDSETAPIHIDSCMYASFVIETLYASLVGFRPMICKSEVLAHDYSLQARFATIASLELPDPLSQKMVQTLIQVDGGSQVPTPAEILKQPYFGHVINPKQRFRLTPSACGVCGDYFYDRDMIPCYEPGHLTCKSCFEDLVHVETMLDNRIMLTKRKGQIGCPGRHPDTPTKPCETMFSMDQILELGLLSKPKTISQLAAAVVHVRESALAQEMAENLEKELKRRLMLSESERHVRHIQEVLLCLHCPSCHQVFIDFEGCMAIRCSKCSKQFCGWCLEYSSSDAHSHVNNSCPKKPSGMEGYFATSDDFNEFHNKRRERLVKTYVEEHLKANPDLRAQVVRQVSACCKELGFTLDSNPPVNNHTPADRPRVVWQLDGRYI